MSKTQFWKEWKDVTRLVKSAQIAFGTEIRQWDSLTEDEKKVTIIQTLSHNNKKYNLSVQDHIASLSNERLLSAMILQFSCGAIEEHGRLITNELLNSGKLQLYQLKVKSFRR